MPFHHKNIRLAATQYTGRRWYFLTLCCAQRRPVFSAPEHADWLVETLRQEAALAGFSVYAYCVMPDHVHALALGVDATSDLLRFVKRLKQRTGYEFRKRFDRELWQKKFHDHILRENELVPGIAAYIWMNPVRRGLCREASEYPHSGSFVLDWKKAPQPVKSWTPPAKRSGGL
ncbi:MAG: REP-associated tyrosine transposase [Candidatus Acidiferrales bacterium]